MISARLMFIFIFFLIGCSTPSSVRLPASHSLRLEAKHLINRLQPFTTDGCGQFQRWIDYPNVDKWSLCCVQHDIAYWKGGTQEDRIESDKQLRQCIVERGEANAAGLIYQNVRGNKDHDIWGYGWVLGRGYTLFTAEEQQQIDHLEKQIPSDLSGVRAHAPKGPSLKGSLTGDRCVDAVIEFIQKTLNRNINPNSIQHEQIPDGLGYLKTVRIFDRLCTEPYEFVFSFANKNACTAPVYSWSTRPRVSLKSYRYPEICQ